jgi:hypothetical protein
MTDNKDIEDKTTKKLTLGGSKLTLGKTVHPRNLSRTMGSSGSTTRRSYKYEGYRGIN